jgi:ER lumen protein retaining receptor
MKTLFIVLTLYTIYLIRYKPPICLVCNQLIQTYRPQEDLFPHYYLYLGAMLLALVFHKSFNPYDLIWSFSVWLEAVAILPQLLMITKSRDI